MEIYLDNSATTKPSPEVVAAVNDAMTVHWHNPSALYRPAMEAEKLMESARECCLKAAGAVGEKLIFTSGGTEADNIAILGRMRSVRKPCRVLMLDVEHPAVLQCAEELRRMGHTVEEIPVTREGTADLEKLENMLGEDVALICMMQVNNESGAIQPLEETAALRDRFSPGAAIHVDGVQGFLRVPINFKRLHIQSYSFSGHKIHCCKGTGGLILGKNYKVNPVVFGGGQEENLRSGTENMPGIIGLGQAVLTYPEDAPEKMMVLKERMWERISSSIPEALLVGPEMGSKSCAPHILNVTLPPVRSQTMLFALEGDGIYVSAGSACASHKQKVSSTLLNMGIRPEIADCALRISFCKDNTEEEIDYAAERIIFHYENLKKYVRR